MPHSPSPTFEIASSVTQPRALIIILHGGRAWSHGRAHRGRLTYLRMLPFSRMWPQNESSEVTVWRLRYRYRGWNGANRDPVTDLHWALTQAQRRHPDIPVILIGHSMGGRAALRSSGHPQVVATCALAPWLTAEDTVDQLQGRDILLVHGDRDQITSHDESANYARQAASIGCEVRFVTVEGDGHAMLRYPSHWRDLVSDFVSRVMADH